MSSKRFNDVYQIISTNWQTHQTELTRIRTQVFIEEQQVPVADEWDGRDQTALHFLLLQEETPIGCARILIEENSEIGRFHIGRVSLLRQYRGQGLGHSLVQHLVDHCQSIDPTQAIYLNAQAARQNFYRILGFESQGEVFMDAGIEHITMRRPPN